MDVVYSDLEVFPTLVANPIMSFSESHGSFKGWPFCLSQVLSSLGSQPSSLISIYLSPLPPPRVFLRYLLNADVDSGFPFVWDTTSGKVDE